MPGFVDTEAFRFVFTGQTAALRAFLNRLASFELPVLVREVEVEPAAAEDMIEPPTEEPAAPAPAEPASETAAAPSVVLTLDPAAPATPPQKAPAAKAPRAAPRLSTATPIVAKPVSKFTVTVEYVSLVPPATPPAEGAETPPQS